MKLMILLSAVVLVMIAFNSASAQIERGDKELSAQMSFMSRSFEQSSNSFWSLLLAARYGYFLRKYLEFEPEIMFSIYKDEDTGFVISGNLAYNFGSRNPGNKVVPFIYAGLGFANTIIFLPNIAYEGAEDTFWTILNGGAGVKLFMTEQIALRCEYRFQRFFETRDITYHTLLFGLSVFFGK